MAKTIVSFIIHKMFVQGNTYIVSMEGYDVYVSLKRSHDLQDLNTSCITVEFPYVFDDNIGDESIHIIIKRKCVAILNRLGEVVRFKTKFYLIERIFEHDLFLLNFSTVDDMGKQRIGSAFSLGGGSFFPINSIPEQNIASEIADTLKNESEEVPFYENLRMDSFYYFATGQFNSAVIIHNTILESIVADHLLSKLIEIGLSEEEAKRRISKIFSRGTGPSEKGGMHKVMSKYFEEIDGRPFKSTTNLWNKFTQARAKRKNVIHPRTTRLSKEATFQTLKDIEEIINWIRKT